MQALLLLVGCGLVGLHYASLIGMKTSSVTFHPARFAGQRWRQVCGVWATKCCSGNDLSSCGRKAVKELCLVDAVGFCGISGGAETEDVGCPSLSA